MSCSNPPQSGVYLSMRFAYFAESLKGLAQTPFGEQVDVLLPELGVYDPALEAFTDFPQTLRVPLKQVEELAFSPPRRESYSDLSAKSPDSPDVQAFRLLELPQRAADAFGRNLPLVAWIYLHRRDEADDPPDARNEALRTRAAAFSPREKSHRQGLIRALEALQRAGFAGAQLDLEPFLPSDVPAMCSLLSELKQKLGRNFVRSVFTPKYVANDGLYTLHPGFVWREKEIYQRLADCSDQLMVPLYDFGPLVRSDATYQQRARELLHELFPTLRGGKRWVVLPQYRQTAQHGPSEEPGLLTRVWADAQDKPEGAAVFVYTGDPTDFDPTRLNPALMP